MSDYNGWKNRQTWNVSLWLNNEEWIYNQARYFMQHIYTGNAPYVSFIKWIGMEEGRTGDNIKWISQVLDYEALNEMMREVGND